MTCLGPCILSVEEPGRQTRLCSLVFERLDFSQRLSSVTASAQAPPSPLWAPHLQRQMALKREGKWISSNNCGVPAMQCCASGVFSLNGCVKAHILYIPLPSSGHSLEQQVKSPKTICLDHIKLPIVITSLPCTET